MSKRWLLYGAYGYSGRLILEESLKKGYKPVIGGRDERKLSILGDKYGLEKVVFNLEDKSETRKALENVELVLNAAGPFIYTAEPFLNACVETKRHYLDITGEIPVFEKAFSRRKEFEKAGIFVMPGVGFDVVPTDCLAKYLSTILPDACELELALAGFNRVSSGTAITMVRFLPKGGAIRKEGEIIQIPFGKGIKKIRFPTGELYSIPIPWGDLVTAYYSTGIKNITTLVAFPFLQVYLLKLMGPWFKRVFSVEAFQRLAQNTIKRFVKGPDESYRKRSRTYIYGCVRNRKGDKKEAWLETVEVYRFTAMAALRCVEKTLAGVPSGFYTPSLAFGHDFVLEIEGSKRYDAL